MCLIMCCEDDKPTYDSLLSAEQLNGHGAGIAWIDHKTKQIKYEKGIDAKKVFAITKRIKLPFIIHFRIATIGGIDEDLCHPFPISDQVELKRKGSANSVLFHNGHWQDWNIVCMKAVLQKGIKFPDNKWSDSRGLAWLADKYGLGFLNLIEDDNKIAVLTPKGIKYFGDGWKNIKHIKCSNDFHENQNFYRMGNYNQNAINGLTDDDDNFDLVGLTPNELEDKYQNGEIPDDVYEEIYNEQQDFMQTYGMPNNSEKRVLEFDRDLSPIGSNDKTPLGFISAKQHNIAKLYDDQEWGY